MDFWKEVWKKGRGGGRDRLGSKSVGLTLSFMKAGEAHAERRQERALRRWQLGPGSFGNEASNRGTRLGRIRFRRTP